MVQSIKRGIVAVGPGVLLCFGLAVPAWLLGKLAPVVGGPVIAILLGMVLGALLRRPVFAKGVAFTSKKVLQASIVLLGFDMNFFKVLQVGGNSVALILSTITVALVVAFAVSKLLKVPAKPSILVGVGSAICGGSAIAATAPVIGAEGDEVSSAISTIFIFNVIAALVFPSIGALLGLSDTGFGLWAGTAVNDTSSVVAAATTWSARVGNDAALDLATIVKLTRTLAIIPITFVLAVYEARKQGKSQNSFNIRKIFPWFILFFLLAAVASTVFALPSAVTKPISTTGKFFIVMAMAAIGLSTDAKKLVKNGAKPILLGFVCWVSIALSSLAVQRLLHMW